MSKEIKNEIIETEEVEVVEEELKGIAGFKAKHPVASKVITGVAIAGGVVLAALGIGKLVGKSSDVEEDDYDYDFDVEEDELSEVDEDVE